MTFRGPLPKTREITRHLHRTAGDRDWHCYLQTGDQKHAQAALQEWRLAGDLEQLAERAIEMASKPATHTKAAFAMRDLLFCEAVANELAAIAGRPYALPFFGRVRGAEVVIQSQAVRFGLTYANAKRIWNRRPGELLPKKRYHLDRQPRSGSTKESK